MREDEMTKLAKPVYDYYKNQLVTATKEEIEEGTKGGEKASYIYIILGKEEQVLYVGETKVSIKDRFCKNTPNHKEKDFYPDIEEIKYLKGDFNKAERLFIEGAFTIVLKPKHMENKD